MTGGRKLTRNRSHKTSLLCLRQEAQWAGEEREHRLGHHIATSMTEATRLSLCDSACGDCSSRVSRADPSVQSKTGRFVDFAASPRCESRSWKVKGAPGGRSDRPSSGSAPWWRVRARGSVRANHSAAGDPHRKDRMQASPSAHSGQRAYEGARGARRIRRRVQPGRTGCIECPRENTSVSSIADFVSRCRASPERSGGARLQCEWRDSDVRLLLAEQLKRDRGSSPSKTTVW